MACEEGVYDSAAFVDVYKRQGLQLLGVALHGFQQGAQIKGAANGKAGIHHGKAHKHRGRRIRHRQRNHVDIVLHERVHHADDDNGEHRPRRR